MKIIFKKKIVQNNFVVLDEILCTVYIKTTLPLLLKLFIFFTLRLMHSNGIFC
jgi:hypothetical protein